MRVIFLHHAGGEKYAWRRYKESLPSDILPILTELPGRGDRYGEPLLRDTDEIIEDLYGQILPHLVHPYIIVGKSMGALHAFLLLQRLISEDKPLPVHVFIGSRKSPGSYQNHVRISELPKKDFWEGVKGYGGLPKLLLEHKELMELYEPILRADFYALEHFNCDSKIQIPVPATIMVGSQDRIKLDELKSWQSFFTEEVKFLELPGGHFFMYEQAFTIGKMIEEQFAKFAHSTMSFS